jgi:hypothetical protein
VHGLLLRKPRVKLVAAARPYEAAAGTWPERGARYLAMFSCDIAYSESPAGVEGVQMTNDRERADMRRHVASRR